MFEDYASFRKDYLNLLTNIFVLLFLFYHLLGKICEEENMIGERYEYPKLGFSHFNVGLIS